MKIQLKRSNVLINGEAKQPSAEQMEYGELAVNYNGDDIAIFIKDDNDNIRRISGSSEKGDTLPDSGDAPGDVFFDTTEGKLYFWDGTRWALVISDESDGSISIDGKASFAGGVNTPFCGSSDSVDFYLAEKYQQGSIGSARGAGLFRLTDTDSTHGTQQAFRITQGGNQPNDATIALNYDGSASFAGGVSANYFNGLTDSGLFNFYRSKGVAGDLNSVWGVENGTQTIQFYNNGSATFAGKVTAASTEASDSGDTVVTKDYLESAGPSLGYWDRSGTTLSPVNTGDNLDGIGSATFAGKVSIDGGSEITAPNSQFASTVISRWTSDYYTTGGTVISMKGDGSANFDGTVEVGQYSGGVQGVKLHNGYVEATNTSGSYNVFLGKLNGTETSSIQANGRASFASGIKMYRSGTASSTRINIGESDTNAVWQNDGNFVLYYDGSASFAGTVSIPSASSTALRIGAAGAGYKGGWDASGNLYLGTNLFAGGENKTVEINNDGSATFKGTISAKLNDEAYTSIAHNGGLTVYGRRDGEAAKTQVYLNNNGDGVFNGNVTADSVTTNTAYITNAVISNDVSVTGSATVAGSVTSTPTSGAAFYAYNGGTSSENAILISNTADGSGLKTFLKYDGSATFAAGVETTGNDVSSGLTVNTTAAGKGIVVLGSSGGDIRLNGNGTASFTGQVDALNFNSTSDIALKKDITPINDAVSRLSNIEGVGFAWEKTGDRTYGVIAQDVEKEFPELVHTTDFKSVNYNGLVGVLIEAVKELKAEIEELKKG